MQESHDIQYGTASSASRFVLVDLLELDGGPDCYFGTTSLLYIIKAVTSALEVPFGGVDTGLDEV